MAATKFPARVLGRRRAVISKETVKDADTRGMAYSVLALVFHSPTNAAERLWEDVRLLLDAMHADHATGEPVASASPPVDFQGLEREYNRLFVGPGHVVCPPYESVYVGDGRGGEKGLVLGPSSRDVLAAYREAGLGLAEGFTDLPDHVAVELEFMKYLCDREAGESDTRWRDRESKFIREHLGRWISLFADSVIKNSATPYYGTAAKLLEEFVAAEVDSFSSESGV